MGKEVQVHLKDPQTVLALARRGLSDYRSHFQFLLKPAYCSAPRDLHPTRGFSLSRLHLNLGPSVRISTHCEAIFPSWTVLPTTTTNQPGSVVLSSLATTFVCLFCTLMLTAQQELHPQRHVHSFSMSLAQRETHRSHVLVSLSEEAREEEIHPRAILSLPAPSNLSCPRHISLAQSGTSILDLKCRGLPHITENEKQIPTGEARS